MIHAMIFVAIGGALGAMARYGLGIYIATLPASVPSFMVTLTVNVIGCAMMGMMASLLLFYPAMDTTIRPFVMIGFLGALTTFSSFALDSFQLLEKQQYTLLALYMTASFVVSLLAFFASYHFMKWVLS